MRRFIYVMLLCWAAPALAQTPTEEQLALSTQSVLLASKQLDAAIKAFAPAYIDLRSKLQYWEDACRSTPECGGSDNKH